MSDRDCYDYMQLPRGGEREREGRITIYSIYQEQGIYTPSLANKLVSLPTNKQTCMELSNTKEGAEVLSVLGVKGASTLVDKG